MKPANLIEAIKRTGHDPYEYEGGVAVNIQKKTWLVFGGHLFWELMKTVNADGTSYNGFVWPLEVGAKVVAPDWNDDGGGVHGLHNGIGRGALLDWSDDAV